MRTPPVDWPEPDQMESKQPFSERLFAKRCWPQYSLRTLFIAVAVISGWLSWEAYRAEQRASAGVALRRLGADASMVVRQPRWLWTLFGERLGQTITYVGVDHEKVELAIPYLKALPDLEEVVVYQHLDSIAHDRGQLAAVPSHCAGTTVKCTSDRAGRLTLHGPTASLRVRATSGRRGRPRCPDRRVCGSGRPGADSATMSRRRDIPGRGRGTCRSA